MEVLVCSLDSLLSLIKGLRFVQIDVALVLNLNQLKFLFKRMLGISLTKDGILFFKRNRELSLKHP